MRLSLTLLLAFQLLLAASALYLFLRWQGAEERLRQAHFHAGQAGNLLRSTRAMHDEPDSLRFREAMRWMMYESQERLNTVDSLTY